MKQKGMFLNALANGAGELHIDGDIGRWDISAAALREQLKGLGAITDLTIYLNSPGGSVIEGLNIYNLIKRHSATVTVIITGLAASMGSVIAMAGDRIIMAEGTLMMIHNPWGGAVGEAADLRKVADILDKMKASLLGTYASKTGLDRTKLSELMDAETWLDATEAAELGFIDTIEGEIDPDNVITIDDAKAMVAELDQPRQEAEKYAAMANPVASTCLNGDIDVYDNPEIHTLKIRGQITSLSTNEPLEGRNPHPTPTEESKPMDELEKQKAALKARNTKIIKMFAKHPRLAELQNECLADIDLSVTDVQAKMLDALATSDDTTPVGGVTVLVDAKAKFVTGSVAALSARAGLGQDDTANEFRGYTLREMARKALELNGVNTGHDAMAMIGQAFTHSSGDFGNILSNVANKAMLKGFEESPESFEQFTSVGSFSDFKENTRVDLGHAPSLPKVDENAEFKHVTLGDKKESAMLATYGSLFGLSRQGIINDDLGMFTRLPAKFGRAARRTVGDLVFSALRAAGNFNAANTLTSQALSAAAIDALRLKMILAKDGKTVTGVRPSYLLTPETLGSTAKQELGREFLDDKNTPNPVRNIVTPITDYRLDDAAGTYYLLADPNMYDALEVQYLNGQSLPTLEQITVWGIDGVQFKVRIDAAAKLWDARSVAKGSA